jgi:hypothetical protein
MIEILEALMIVSFGVSWPANIIKSVKARTAKGKSLVFLICVLFGYLCGIAAKLMTGRVTYVLVFYFINILMVTVDILLYFRNRKFDRLQG